MSKSPYFHEPQVSENTDYERNDSIVHNIECNKLFITSLLGQLNAIRTLPFSISAIL